MKFSIPFFITVCAFDSFAQSASMIDEDYANGEVRVFGDLIVNGNGITPSPSLEVGGGAEIIGEVAFEDIAYFDEVRTRNENYLNFDARGLSVTSERHEWDDRWRLEAQADFLFDADGMRISSGESSILIKPHHNGTILINGAPIARKDYVDSIFDGSGLGSFKAEGIFGYTAAATGEGSVSFGAGVAAGFGSWAAGGRTGNRDDGYLGPYSGGRNSHAYGEVSRALGHYAFAFGDGDYDREPDDIDQENPHEPGYFPTDALGFHSFAFGYSASAEGAYSFAFGRQTRAAAEKSFAFGERSEAHGDSSAAFGLEAKTYGLYSAVFGRRNTATSRGISVFGEGAYGADGDPLNWVPTDPLFVIGNSGDDGDRSSALRILKNGHTVIGSHGTPPPGGGNQVLEVLGALQVGNTASGTAGSIRWTGSDFEGFDGSEWKSLTRAPTASDTPRGDISMGAFVAD